MNFRTLLAATLMAAGGASASPYDQPWAQVESGADSDVRKEGRVSVTKVDGKSTRNPRRSDALAAGKHVITIRFESARGTFSPNTVDLEMDLEPCVRYRMVAAYESKTGPDWKPKAYAEPIGECRSKFLKGK